MSEIKDCAKCKEDASVVGSDGKFMVCVRRISHCKGYVPPKKRWVFQTGFFCKTKLHPTKEDAIAEWNRLNGR